MKLEDLELYAKRKYLIEAQNQWDQFPGFSVLAEPLSGKWLALLMRRRDPRNGTIIETCDIKCGRMFLPIAVQPFLSSPFRMKGPDWVGVRFHEKTQPAIVYKLFDKAYEAVEKRGYQVVLDDTKDDHTYQDTPLSFQEFLSDRQPSIPSKIIAMNRLNPHRDRSFKGRCKDFYIQAQFMADYEDDAFIDRKQTTHIPTYRNLSPLEQRGYFSWRTEVRKGMLRRVSGDYVKLYFYELLCGVHGKTPAETLDDMLAFVEGYYVKDELAKVSFLMEWMLDYAVMHRLAPKRIFALYQRPDLAKSRYLHILEDTQKADDHEICEALDFFASKKSLALSPVIKKDVSLGEHLFAETWRIACRERKAQQGDLLKEIFGEARWRFYEPFMGAITYWEEPLPEGIYSLNETLLYQYKNGVWFVYRHDLNNTSLIDDFLHETDRILRPYLNIRRALKKRPGCEWIEAAALEAIKAEEERRREALQPKITIDLSSLSQIRDDAAITRDSLLVEEEPDDLMEAETDTSLVTEDEEVSLEISGLDELHSHLLWMLAHHQSVAEEIKKHHLMASVVSDTINEALFDEIGDTILECDGETITLIDDYQEDVLTLLGGSDE